MANAKKVDVEKAKASVLMIDQQAAPMAQVYAVKFPAGKDVIDTVIAQIATLDASGAVTAFEPMKDITSDVIEKLWDELGYFNEHKSTIDLTDKSNEHFTDPLTYHDSSDDGFSRSHHLSNHQVRCRLEGHKIRDG